MKRSPALALLGIAFCATLHAGEPALEISDAWIREAPPNAPVLAAYMVLHNSSPDEMTITAFSSPLCSRIEIHRTVMREGVAHMQRTERLVVEGGDTVALKTGGSHLMLFMASGSPQEGKQIPITLDIAGHEPFTVLVPVRKATADDVAPRENHGH